MLAVCGFLAGGAISLARQGRRLVATVLGLAAVLAAVTAWAWWQ